MELEGPGEKELPSPYRSGTTVEVRTIVGTTATVRVEGEDIELVEGRGAHEGSRRPLPALTKVSGQSVSLLVTPQ